MDWGRRRRQFALGVWLPFLFGLYLLLVDTFIAPELLAAAGASLLAASLAVWIHHRDCYRIRMRLSWARALWWLPPASVRGAGDAAVLLWAQVLGRERQTGRLTTEPTPSGSRSRLGAGRRVALTLLSSTPPSSVVLGVDGETGLVHLHRIDRRSGSALIEAGPQ